MVYRLSSAFSYTRVNLEYLKKTSEESIYITRAKMGEKQQAGSSVKAVQRCTSEDKFKSSYRTKATLLASRAYIIVTTPF